VKYLVIYEKIGTGYNAYVPDLPGFITTGATLQEAEQMMKEAIEFHLEGMREEGLQSPNHPPWATTSPQPEPRFRVTL